MAQQRVLHRIASQRARIRERQLSSLQAQAAAQASPQQGPSSDASSLLISAAALACQHPVAVAVLVGVAVAAGPRRLIRWSGVVLPWLLRLRR